MAWASSSPYFIVDAAFAYDDSPGTAESVQVSLSGNIFGLGNSRLLTTKPERFTLLPRQCSYPSGRIKANRGTDDCAGSFSHFALGKLLNNRSLYDGVSWLEAFNNFEVEDEIVGQKHVDILSDGVYLDTASQESFIGVSLSASGGQTTFTRSTLSVQLDGPASQSDTSSTPRPLLQDYSASLTLHESNIPNHIPQPPNQPSNAGKGAYQHARQHNSKGAEALPAALPRPAYSADVFDGVSSPEPATRRSSRTSVRTYSSLRKDRTRSPEHDFAVVIVERESSGESTDCSEPTNGKGSSIQSSEHSIAAKAANIIRDWKVESNFEEQLRMGWEAYGKYELETGPACHRIAWRKDLLLRDCQYQIQTKLRNGHVFILQKLPPAVFKTKVVTCAHPYCSAPQKHSLPASYRLSLEPKENMKRAVVPTEPLHRAHVIERCVGKIKDDLCGKGEAGVTWYCLTCVEDLWRGDGMLQGKPQVKQCRRRGLQRRGEHVNLEHLGLPGERSSVDTAHHPDLSPLRKRAKLFIRGPQKPTKSATATTQPGDVEEVGLNLVTQQGSKKVESWLSSPHSTEGEQPTEKAFDKPSIAGNSFSTLSNEEEITNTRRFKSSSTVQKPFTIIAKKMSRRHPLSLDGMVTDMPPPPARSRDGVGQATIQQAAMEVRATITEEQEADEGASSKLPLRPRTASSCSMPQSVPFASIHPADDPTSLSSTTMEHGSKSVAHTTPTMTRSTQPIITPVLSPKASERPLHPIDADRGYITEISGDEVTHSHPLEKSSKTFAHAVPNPLRRQREVEIAESELDSETAKGALSKKRKVLDDEKTIDPNKPAAISNLQSAAESRARRPVRHTKGRLLTRADDAHSTGPRLPTGKGTRTHSKMQRVGVDPNLPALSTERGHLPVPVPEHWCICQQPGDEQDMLQCDGEYCLVGWFHLRCTGLAMMPAQDEPWYCRACHPPYPHPFDGPPDSPSLPPSHPHPQNKTPLKRPRTHSPPSAPSPVPSSAPAHEHLPPQPPPPASTNSTSHPALAPIAHFIHPETRSHPSGHYALASPQMFALRRWKAVICHQRMFDVPGNRGFMERNGLDYGYPDQEDGEVVVDVLREREDGDGDAGGGGQEVDAKTSMGIMEIGGLVVEVTKKEVKGGELSWVLGVVDGRVEEELVRLGWWDEGSEWEKVGGRGKVRLKLRVGERRRDGEDESRNSERDERDKRELDKEGESGKVRLKLRVGRKDVRGFQE